MKSFSSWLACFLVIMLACTGSTLADDDQVVRQTIISKLKSARSDLDYKFIGPSEIPAFYEVQVMGGPILYVSKDGEFFFDLYQGINGSEKRLRSCYNMCGVN